MFDVCKDPGFGIEGHGPNLQFVMGRMRDMNRADFPCVSARIEARTPVKLENGKIAPVTASTDTMVGMMVCEKPDGVERHNVFTQGDFNRDLVNVPAGVDLDELQTNSLAAGLHIFLKTPIFGGAE